MTRRATVLSLPEAPLAELAAASFDVLWIDLEHGALTVRDALGLTLATQAAGCEAHVRLPSTDSDLLAAVLDAGVDGVVAPRVEDPEAAAALVARLRYPPDGNRGYGPRRAGAYGRVPALWASDEAQVECTIQVESAAGVEAAGALGAVDGVDRLVLGTADLSLALGVPLELSSPAMKAAADAVAAGAAAAGAGFGVAGGGDPGALAALAAGRAELLVYATDIRLYGDALAAAAAALEEDAHAAA